MIVLPLGLGALPNGPASSWRVLLMEPRLVDTTLLPMVSEPFLLPSGLGLVGRQLRTIVETAQRDQTHSKPPEKNALPPEPALPDLPGPDRLILPPASPPTGVLALFHSRHCGCARGRGAGSLCAGLPSPSP
eukprot:11860245-Heterocapsa_arctica.AAC.1